MPTAHLTEAQKLSPSALIELFTLDTSTCIASATPGSHTVGEVYRWCAGNVEQREAGTTAVVAPSGTVITVERSLVSDSLATYVFSCVNPATGDWVAPKPVTSVSGATITLASTLGFTPPAGTPWNLYAQHAVRFAGVTYPALPIEATGFEWNGQGKMPRPKLRVSNIGGMATGLLVAFGDLLGATVTRTRTFYRFIDGQPTADPTAVFESDVFRVDRKSAHTPATIEFELASDLDQMGLRLPRRQMLRNTCSLEYRRRWVRKNLNQYSDYHASGWANGLTGTGATLTTGIDDPFGGLAAVRVTGTGTAQMLLRINFSAFTANGTDTYALSFYARLKSAGTMGALAADLRDGAPNGAYDDQLILDQYVRVALTGVPTAGGKEWIDLINNVTTDKVIDICGVQIEKGTESSPLERTSGALVGNSFSYGTCPYTGSNYFKIDGTSTADPAEDVCDHHMSGCKLRFGDTTPLPIDAFPGIALVRA